ncbi:cyclopropane-fatty-acyl-phospholipid synthase family protein [Idiomarina sp. MD25a]|uniref:SAM-dependent methyltransferase n=1 Tax=Idiomarina sp. MD25a TaxID=1889913 RepID=UPI0009F3334B|nr:class I SAM-dependent methyltransferase [Idiomarina sp. MD25a]
MESKNFWNDRYSDERYLYGKQPNDFLKYILPPKNDVLKPDSQVLCLAEGEGRNAVYLAECGLRVTAIDISSVALAKGKKLADERGVSVDWKLADLSEYDFGEKQWDAIVAIFMHLSPDMRKSVLNKIPSALTNEGIFIGEFYRKEQLQLKTGGPQDEALMYSEQQLKEDLNPLEFIHLVSVKREVVEGTGHTGEAAVVQVVAKKVAS